MNRHLYTIPKVKVFPLIIKFPEIENMRRKCNVMDCKFKSDTTL